MLKMRVERCCGIGIGAVPGLRRAGGLKLLWRRIAMQPDDLQLTDWMRMLFGKTGRVCFIELIRE
jgi:hypothetical protein